MDKLIKAGATYHRDSTTLIVEARALQDGVWAAVEARSKRVIIEGDNATVIQSLKGQITTLWHIAIIIHNISKYLSVMDYSIHHFYVFKEANKAVDW